ncbi:DUF3325 domain-containing protein [Sphingopyxis witflariensis]|uniref:DUF3325 domain-containing protein n=1 Tax=Sphingopyxis witflariensis TaxID=173675 RepID=A0A2D0AN79_9SPHN|nr:DUF3325 domain-containing protein [Sphingopyxis witflariensis]OWQ95208.1 hypothetical protein CDQ91_14980 [Sphingopyxis witflariensis]
MIDLFATLLALCGFALLSISMPRHQADMAGGKLAPAASRRARVGGYALLFAVLVLDGFAFGAAYGAIAWFGHLSIGAWSVVAWLCVCGRGTNSASKKKSTTPTRGEN